jgi:CrcB protein
MTVWTWVFVALLGGAGSVARFLVDGYVSERAAGEFPWGTFAVNVSGAMLLGLLAGAAVSGNALVLAGTATLGSYTTLSTWMFETHRLAQNDELMLATVNIVAMLAAGFAAAALGHAIGAQL